MCRNAAERGQSFPQAVTARQKTSIRVRTVNLAIARNKFCLAFANFRSREINVVEGDVVPAASVCASRGGFYDSPCPVAESADQASGHDCAHCLGHDKNVFVYKMISQGSVEEKIGVAKKETPVSHNSTDAGVFKHLTAEDIRSCLVEVGASRVICFQAGAAMH